MRDRDGLPHPLSKIPREELGFSATVVLWIANGTDYKLDSIALIIQYVLLAIDGIVQRQFGW